MKAPTPPGKPRFYILDEAGNPQLCEDVYAFAAWSVKSGLSKFIKVSHLPAQWNGEDLRISTVFLGLDHNHFDGPPLIYETVIFFGGESRVIARYSTPQQAVAGHMQAVETALKMPMRFDLPPADIQ